jgi:hypothetical protein
LWTGIPQFNFLADQVFTERLIKGIVKALIYIGLKGLISIIVLRAWGCPEMGFYDHQFDKG